MDKLTALDSFSALSQASRLDAFRLLIKAGGAGMLAGDISDALGVRQNTMSTNLSILARAGLIRNERHGRSIRYFADMGGVQGLLKFLLEDCCGGDADACQPILYEILAQSCAVSKDIK